METSANNKSSQPSNEIAVDGGDFPKRIDNTLHIDNLPHDISKDAVSYTPVFIDPPVFIDFGDESSLGFQNDDSEYTPVFIDPPVFIDFGDESSLGFQNDDSEYPKIAVDGGDFPKRIDNTLHIDNLPYDISKDAVSYTPVFIDPPVFIDFGDESSLGFQNDDSEYTPVFIDPPVFIDFGDESSLGFQNDDSEYPKIAVDGGDFPQKINDNVDSPSIYDISKDSLYLPNLDISSLVNEYNNSN
ncbi:hypothetical protein ASE99_24370 [Serratia sp. Leaf51]|nr:hypothetical protein ASE99_24370 [Serratia sp. Leaf51]